MKTNVKNDLHKLKEKQKLQKQKRNRRPKKKLVLKKLKNKRSKNGAGGIWGANGNVESTRPYDWSKALASQPSLKAAPVSCFEHVPDSTTWSKFPYFDLKVEVKVKERPAFQPEGGKPYWIGSILEGARGYMCKVRYLGFREDGSWDRWLNICTELHRIGYAQTCGYSLIPPLKIAAFSNDWTARVQKNLANRRTLKPNHYHVFQQYLKSGIEVGSVLEVLDKTHVARMRLATVIKSVGGRVHFTYWDSEKQDVEDFWSHKKSPAIHPQGWCKTIGHEINAPDNYDPPELSEQEIADELRSTYGYQTNGLEYPVIEVGVRLEAVDPLNLSKICSATVVRVLRFGYFMVQIDGANLVKRSQDLFCYHITSPLIFPCGFCKLNDIALEPPSLFIRVRRQGDTTPFDWDRHFLETSEVPLKFHREELAEHGFQVGMKLEAVDVMTPNLIAVATISGVFGRLLKIHFDGWGESFDQWADAKSVDLFPIGWCQAVGHRLEPPGTE